MVVEGIRKLTRRQFMGGIAAGAIAGIGGYSFLVEPNQVTVDEVQLRLARLPDAFQGLRIAQLSDLHYGPFTGERAIGRAVAQANALRPDITVITGDFITASFGRSDTGTKLADAEACATLLGRLKTRFGRFACLGNHDFVVDPNGIQEILSRHGIRVVRNSASALELDGNRVWIAGVDDVLRGAPDLERTLRATAREFTILLAHEPDFADQAARYPIDLQLSGHSHGGQIRLPAIGALYYPTLSRRYPRGRYQVGNLLLYTNRGIGTIVVPARLGAPPEVTLFTLLRGGGES